MIDSKPTEPFLDHDHIEDSSGRIYITVGNTHPPGAVIAYLKYVPTPRRTYWCRGFQCYERVVKKYGVDYVLSVAREHQEEVYDPSLGVTVPIVRLWSIASVYRPRERLQEVLKNPRDSVEADAVIAYEKLRECSGVHSGSIGVDGSIAVGIQNPKISDVDLVVYGCREALDVVESIQGSFEAVPTEVEAERLTKMSEIYRLPLEVVRAISAPYKRLYLRERKREVNLLFSDDSWRRYGESVLVPVALVEAEVLVESRECRSLFYPGVARVDRVLDLRVLWSLRESTVDLRNEVTKIVTYESIYSYPLYMGGEIRVRGVLSIEKPNNDLVITVGTREIHSYAIPRKFRV
ncbi:MAG: hypothetical protein QXZ37_03155 [Sulfolobales archaeon]